MMGAVLRWILPHGGRHWRGGRGAVEAEQRIREFWGLTRHEWLDLHFWLAVVFVIVIVTHILLHWDWIRCYIKSCMQHESEK